MTYQNNNVLIALVILITMFGCTGKNEISVEGNWYYFTHDSTYSEVYFSEGKAMFYDENIGGGPIYQYSINKDSIYISYRGDLKHRYQVNLTTKSLIFTSNNESYKLYKLEDEIDYLGLPNTMQAVDTFDYEFAQRMFKNKP